MFTHIGPVDRPLRALAVILGFGTLAACAASRGPAVGAAVPPVAILITIDDATDGFRPAAKSVSQRRLEDFAISFGHEGGRAAPLRLKLRLTHRNLTESETETIWRMTTILLATLYPSTCQHRSYNLAADLILPDGQTLSYEEVETTVAWLWLFHGSGCGETPSREEVESVTRQMLDSIYDRMFEDDAFGLQPFVPARARPPLVRVTVNRADAIVEQVLRVDRPFERWAMTDRPGVIPDYRVDLHYDVRTRGFSIHRAYLSIMTFGATGMCKSTPVSLIATVTSPHAAKSISYQVSESVRGRFAETDCESQDETTRPEVFARLMRRVLAQIKSDALVATVTAPAGSDRPWLYVDSNIAKGIVRRETINSRLFPRYLFAEAAEYRPGYSLKLNLDFQGGGRRAPGGGGQSVREALALAWLGRNKMCKPGELVLDAVLRDTASSEIRHYQRKREFEFSEDTDPDDCRDNELTNPEIVVDSIRWLFDEMKRDGTLALLDPR